MKNLFSKVKKFFTNLTSNKNQTVNNDGTIVIKKPNDDISLTIKRADSDNKFFKWFTLVMAVIAIGMTLTMLIFLIVEASQLGTQGGVFHLFGLEWDITSPTGQRIFGALSSLVGSFATVGGALVIGVPLGIATAVIISRYTSGKRKTILNQLIALFAGIPSVVWGFFGITVLVPMFKSNLEGTGQGEGLLVSILVLALMIIPTIVNISVNTLDSASGDYVQASTALGNTKHQTTFRIILPSCKRGIIVACILGLGRALGEGIALSMICGNANALPTGLFSSFNTMTTLIFSSFQDADIVVRQALFCIGLVLFVFTVVINLIVNMVGKEKSGRKSKNKLVVFIKEKVFKMKPKEKEAKYKTVDLSKQSEKNVDFSMKKNSKTGTNILFGTSFAFAIITFAIFLIVIGYILVNGLPLLFSNITTVFTPINPLIGGISLMSEIGVTFLIILITLLVCVPVGIFVAIYLNQYANEDSLIIKGVRFAIQVLAGAPGIIIGLLGYTLFVSTGMFGRGYTVLAGILTLSIMCLPTVVNTVENAFIAVPKDYLDAATAMGVGKVRIITRILIPQSLTGIFSAIILTVGKVIAESAALIFTSGTMVSNPNLYGSGATLAVSMYMYALDGIHLNDVFVAGVIIVLIIIIINLIMYFIQKKAQEIGIKKVKHSKKKMSFKKKEVK